MGALAKFIRMDTKLVIINHASNVSGVVNDIESAARICNQRRVPLLIDAAQTNGRITYSCPSFKGDGGISRGINPCFRLREQGDSIYRRI